MSYLYLKAIHIIFVVTWFSGMFYLVRLFIYHREAQDKPSPEKEILSAQFQLMIRRLWLGITWPSAVLTLFFGTWLVLLLGPVAPWLWLKIAFVAGLYAYHFSLQHIYRQQMKGVYRHTSAQLRLWNEVATVFLVTIVILVVVKTQLSVVWGLTGLILFIMILMAAIKIYQRLRQS